MSTNILVFIEQRSGKILPASFQLFTVAGKLAEGAGGQVQAVIVGHNIAGLAQQVASFGARKVLVIDDAELALYRVMPYAAAVTAAMDAAQPKVVLFPTTFMGRDLASRVAARKRAALAIDCTEVAMEGGDLIATKPVYAGKFSAKFRLSASRLQVATVRSNAYSAPAPQAGASAEVQQIPLALREVDKRAKIKEIASTTSGVKDVTEGDIVVSGGEARVRGVETLEGAQVMATDLRASVSLVIAALAARGETVVSRVYHLDRGFERLEEKLSACGANVRRIAGTGEPED